MVYTLTNSVNDGADIRWSAFTNRNWITLSRTGGTLSGGQSATVRATINGRANGLESQLLDHTGTITFRDQTNGDDRERDFALDVTAPEEPPPGSLEVTPDEPLFGTSFESSGPEGGPFVPGSMVYTLTNSVNDGADIRWSVFTNRNWITLSSTGGTLAGGQSATVRATINGRANGLESQLLDHTGTITFRDQTNGDDRERDFALDVTAPEEPPPGSLEVTPDEPLFGTSFESSGPEGGPFVPGSMVYTLTNSVNDGADIRWSALTNRNWITLSSTGGTLSGGQSATVRATINGRANGLESQLPDHMGTITFRDQTNGDDRERDFALDVTPEGIHCRPYNSGSLNPIMMCAHSADTSFNVIINNIAHNDWSNSVFSAREWEGWPSGKEDDWVHQAEQIARWVLEAQKKLDEIDMSYNKNVVISISDIKDEPCGEVSNITHRIYLFKEMECNPKPTTAQEYFHHAQYHNSSTDKWLMEATAQWFEDEVYDELDTYYHFRNVTGRPILKKGLGNTDAAGYERSIFIKLLSQGCGKQAIGSLFDEGQPDDGLSRLSRLLGNSDCHFGDHLGPGNRDSLESALSYYNYATMYPYFPLEGNVDAAIAEQAELSPGGKLSLLDDTSDPNCTYHFDGQVFTTSYLCFADPDRIDVVSTSKVDVSIPASGAISYRVEAGGDQSIRGGRIHFDFSDDAVVSIAGSQDFRDNVAVDKNLIGPHDHISEVTSYHRWFEVEAGTPYTYEYHPSGTGGILPKLFVTIVNPSWDSDVTGEVTFYGCARQIQPGSAIVGRWTGDCASGHRPDGGDYYARYHTFTLDEDAEVTIPLTSETVDTYLYLLEGVGADGAVLHENNDFGEAIGSADLCENFQPENVDTHSCIRASLAPGTYTIEATTYGAGETGDFRLMLLADATESEDRAVLIALYEATGGQNWSNDTNWLSNDAPLGEWHGVTTDASGRVTELNLPNNGLTRPIPAELAQLSNLRVLNLRDNRLSGPIPAWLGSIANLERLLVSNNLLTGEIPAELGNLGSLEQLLLGGNQQLGGCIPVALRSIAHNDLDELGLAFCAETANRPPRFDPGQASVRTVMEDARAGTWVGNTITATDPDGDPLHTFLRFTSQEENDSFSAAFDYVKTADGGYIVVKEDSSLDYSEKPSYRLKVAVYDGNHASYPEVDDLFDLTINVISSDAEPEKEGSSLDRTALVKFYNATGGPNWSDNTNWLSDAPIGEWFGVTANSDGRVTRLYQVDNQLSGTLPPELGNLTHLSALSLYINRLSGAIPPELGQLNRLTYLGLFDNRLSGEMPPELGNLASLRWLILPVNQLSGEIPSTLGRLANLERLELSSNQLTGQIPAELGNLAELERLWLSRNQLGGCIPEALSQVPDNDLDALGLPFCEP